MNDDNGFIMLPNQSVDAWMKKMSSPEFKAFVFIYRKVRLLQRQTDFETKIKEQLAGLERQVSEVFAMQQSALVQACAALTELIEARTKFKPGSASSN